MMRRVMSVLALLLTLLMAVPVLAQDEASVPFWMASVETPVWAVILLTLFGVSGGLTAIGMSLAMRGMATPEIVRLLASQGQLIFQSIPVQHVDKWLADAAERARRTDTPVDDIAVLGAKMVRDEVYGQGSPVPVDYDGSPDAAVRLDPNAMLAGDESGS
jgi:uncharacterized integral membrane protein